MRDGSSLIDWLSWRRFSWLTWLKLPIFRQFLVQQMKTNSKTISVSENKEYAII
jgi:hypothetical protein